MIKNKANDMTTMRAANTLMILKALYEENPISRSQLSRLTNLSSSAVTSIVKDLINQKLVIEKSPVNISGVGRPGKPLVINSKDWYIIAIHLSGELSLKINVFNLLLEKKADFNFKLANYEPATVIKEIIENYHYLKESAVIKGSFIGLGISLSGIVSSQENKCYYSEIMGWEDVDLAELFADQLDIPVIVARDVNGLALSQFMNLKKTAEPENLAVVMIGRGIGLGMVINGKIYSGNLGGAGEISHLLQLKTAYQGRCKLGQAGCISTLLKKEVISARLLDSISDQCKLSQTEIVELKNEPLLFLDSLFDEQELKKLLTEVRELVAELLKLITEIYAPEKLIISSNYGFGNKIVELIKLDYLNKFSLPDKFAAEIIFQEHYDTEWARGAAAVVLNNLLTDSYLLSRII